MTTQLAINIIRTDGDTQPRIGVNEWKVRDYALDMMEGDEFPPIVVFYDGDNYWLSAGFHRLAAARQIGRETILATVREGGPRDAFLYAVDDNRHNGVQYTNADKRVMVERFLSDEEWQRWSDREIARRCGVSHPFVSSLRDDTGNDYQYDADRTFIHHKTGQPTTMNTANIGRREEAIDGYFKAHPELERFTCPDCGEIFDIQVWHCPVCDHHWQMHRTSCWNCHEYERDPDSSIPPPANEGDYPYGESQIEEAEYQEDSYEAQRGQQFGIMMSAESKEWYTPSWIIDRARDVLGGIDLDPASCPEAQTIVKAEAYCTIEEDGYAQPWMGRVWLNPPYGTEGEGAAGWARKLVREYEVGQIDAAILLVKAALGYNWFEELWYAYPTCLLRERVSFVSPIDGTDRGPAKHATALIYFGDDVDRFRAVFRSVGRVILPEDETE